MCYMGVRIDATWRTRLPSMFGGHAKTAEPIEMRFGVLTRVGQKNHVLDEGPDRPMSRGNFLGERTCAGMPDDTLS